MRQTGTLLAFLGVGLALRLFGRLYDGLWYDEIAFIVDTLRVPFEGLLTKFKSDNNHPLYSVLAWLSVKALGETAFAVRLPAVLFGTASLGALWILARRVTSRAEALLATALLTVSYHHVWFSQNARGYTALLFFTLLATLFLLRGYEGGRRRDWLAYAASLAFATYSHTSALFVAFAHGTLFLVAVLLPRKRGQMAGGRRMAPLVGLVAAGVMSLVLHATLLPEMISYFRTQSHGGVEGRPVGPVEWDSAWWTIKAVALSLGVGLIPGLVALAGGLITILVGVVDYGRRNWMLLVMFLGPGVLGAVAIVALDRSIRPRFFLNLAGFILLIVVRGVFCLCDQIAAWAPERRAAAVRVTLRWAAAGLMMAVSLAILPRVYRVPKQDFEAAREYVEGVRQPEDAVVTVGLATLPYKRFFEAGFTPVASLEELHAARDDQRRVYILHTLPIYVDSRTPRLAEFLADHGQEVARFHGSLGDGDVIVLAVDGTRGT